MQNSSRDGLVLTQHFEGPAADKNAEKLCEFVRTNELKREQIISVCMQETQIEEGLNMTTLFYFKEAKQGCPFDDLQYVKFNSMHSFENQHKEAKARWSSGTENPVALTCTARNTLGVNNVVMFYGKNGPQKVFVKQIRQENGKHDELIKEVTKYLNTYIAPHQLISVDMFEHSHPNLPDASGDTVIYANIMHTAGDDPASYKDKKIDTMPEKIYISKIFTSGFEGTDYRKPYEQARDHMNAEGDGHGYIVAGCNISGDSNATEDEQYYGAIRVVVW